jgi:hypothetical protein
LCDVALFTPYGCHASTGFPAKPCQNPKVIAPLVQAEEQNGGGFIGKGEG